MRVLDAHAHLGTWGDFLLPQPGADWLVDVMTAQGVEAAGVSHLLGVGHDAVTGNNLALAAARRHPGRLYVWLVGSPHDPDAVARLRDQLDEPGVWGVKLHPDTHQMPLDDPRYSPLLEVASAAGVPVLTHTQHRSPWSDPVLAAVVANRWPCPLLMGHGGLFHDGLLSAARLASQHSTLYVESASSRLTRHWLRRVIDEAGADKVLYGSDALFLDPRSAIGRLHAADLAEDERAKVAGANLAGLLGDRLPARSPGGSP